MQQVSVVIICKNEARVIGETLNSFTGLTDDIVVYDNGSTDGTQEIVKHYGVRLLEGTWEGFGKTKNKAISLARYDWVMSLDADEAIDESLKQCLLQLTLHDEKTVYELQFKNFLGTKWLRFGEWGGDKHIRLFNRKQVQWNTDEVHEALLLPQEVRIIRLPGFVLHKTAADIMEYKRKMKQYAAMNAEKYFKQGKKAGIWKIYFAPLFSFLKHYVFRLGFLDGAEGFQCARISAGYTYWKYKTLRNLAGKS